MNFSERDLTLYAVTDRSWLGTSTLPWQVEQALKGGATMIQLREKDLDHDAFLQEAKEIKLLCARYRVPFIINDDVDLALEVDADGVHVGQSDLEAGLVREKMGPNRIVGVSAQTLEQALLAQQRGADYLGVGAVFPTSSKSDAVEVGPQTLREICQGVQIPVVAIGGISAQNLHSLQGSGIAGIAVISAIFAQKDIFSAAEDLRRRTEEMLSR